MSSMFDYARLPSMDAWAAGDEEEPLGIYEDVESRAQRTEEEEARFWARCPNWFTNLLPELSLKERLLGCATCMICGYLLSLGSFLRMKDLLGGNPGPLVFTVTLGNIMSLCGTFFLAGPKSQIQRMFKPTRIIASSMYLGSLAVTFALLLMPAFLGRGFLLLLLLLSQYASITWYSLTYIPFAREILRKCCRRFVSSDYDGDD